MRLQDKYTRLLAGILIICMMLPIMPQVTARVSAAERTVSTFAELVEACKTDGVISLANDIIVTDSIILTERINIEIKGNGYTLRVPTPFLEEDGTAAQAPSEHYIFYAGSRLSKLKFSDVTFMGGAKSALYVNYNCSDVTLDRIIVTRSYKAINTNSTFRMNNSIGYNNAYGVVSLMKNARALINDCSFSNNCSPSYGGAINNNGTAIVNNSTINYNYAVRGGGIYNTGTLYVSNSNIFGNLARTEKTSNNSLGGGVYNESVAHFYNSIITNNYFGTYNIKTFVSNDLTVASAEAQATTNLYNSIVTSCRNYTDATELTLVNVSNSPYVNNQQSNTSVFNAYESVPLNAYGNSKYQGKSLGIKVQAPLTVKQPNATYAAEYSNQSIALTGGCETIFGLISGTLYYGLYNNGDACKVTTFQGGSKRTPSVIGAGTSKDYSIAVSTSIQNGTIKLVGAGRAVDGASITFTVTPANGFVVKRVYYTKDGDEKAYEVALDKATVYNTERSFETTMPAANITLNAEFSAIPIVKAPKKVVMSSAKNASKLSVTVKWKKTACTKYEVQIATNKKFKKGLKQKTVKSSKSSYTFKKLKKNKVYYVRVRAYNGAKAGSFSKVKKVKIKK